MKKFFFILFAAFLLFTLVEVRYLFTDGFSSRKILYGAPYNEENEPYEKNIQKYNSVLSQKFSYLSKGRQTYVFESADKKYVLKFMRYHKYRLPFWSSFVSFFNSQFIKKHFYPKEQKFHFVTDSYKIALNDLQSLSQVEYVHLNQTNFLNIKVEAIDKLGVRHFIDLDEVAFIIQKKSSPLSKTLVKLIKNQKKEEVHKVIDSFFERLTFRTNKRIINIDSENLIRNCGLDGCNIIEQDVGSFLFIGNDNNCLYRNFLNSVLEFRLFLEKNGKEYVPFFDEKLAGVEKCLKL